MIRKGDKMLTTPQEVAESMNSHYIHTADNIGCDKNLSMTSNYETSEDFTTAAIDHHINHRSIQAINNLGKHVVGFIFYHLTPQQVGQIIKGLNSKKVTGSDAIVKGR